MEEKNKNIQDFESMSNDELNTALYDKLSAEQDKFREYLESLTAADALQHAYEYIVRQDILFSFDDNNLSSAQAKAMLQNNCTLEDIYKDWEKKETDYMQDIWDTVAERADIFIRREQEKLMQFAGVPVYNQTYAYAKEHNEVELALQSHKADVACGKAIEAAIKKHYSGYSLDTDKAIAEVVPRFGMERLKFVLANMVRHKDWDGRISRQNKEWAKGIPEPPEERRSQQFIAFTVHSCLLNFFTDSVRELPPEHKQEQNKARSSVLAQLQQPKTPTKPAPAKKHKQQEL